MCSREKMEPVGLCETVQSFALDLEVGRADATLDRRASGWSVLVQPGIDVVGRRERLGDEVHGHLSQGRDQGFWNLVIRKKAVAELLLALLNVLAPIGLGTIHPLDPAKYVNRVRLQE